MLTQAITNQTVPTTSRHIGNQMTKAIKDYKDEFFTGLTDDEKKAIEDAVFAYADEHAKNGKIDRNELVNLVAKLLAEYGFKGNLEEAIKGFVSKVCDEKGNLKEGLLNKKATPEAANLAYHFSRSKALALKEQCYITPKDAKATQPKEALLTMEALQNPEEINASAITTKTITAPDGSKMILVLRGAQIIHQFKVGKDAQLSKEQLDLILLSK